MTKKSLKNKTLLRVTEKIVMVYLRADMTKICKTMNCKTKIEQVFLFTLGHMRTNGHSPKEKSSKYETNQRKHVFRLSTFNVKTLKVSKEDRTFILPNRNMQGICFRTDICGGMLFISGLHRVSCNLV